MSQPTAAPDPAADAVAPSPPDGAAPTPRQRRDFRRFMASHVCNELGGSITYVALPLTAVLTLNASAWQAGALAAAECAPPRNCTSGGRPRRSASPSRP
ncbi:hypothetical protein ABZ054_36460, partial [Streptomyces sp. NPDC006324]